MDSQKTKAALIEELRVARERISALEATSTWQVDKEFVPPEPFRLLLQNVKDVLWILRLPETLFCYLSPSVEKLTGYTVEEMMDEDFSRFISPDDLDKVQAAIDRALASNEEQHARAINLELTQIRKDGSAVPVEIVASILRDANGQPEAILGVTRDISEHKQANESLRSREEDLRTIVSSMSDIVFVFDREDRFLEVHCRADSPLYLPPPAVIGKRLQDVMPAPTKDLYSEASSALRRTGETQKYEYPLPIDGEQRWFVATLDLHHDGERILAGIRDITDRKQAERSLRESEQRLQAIFSSTPDYLMLLDRDHRIRLINRLEPGRSRDSVIGAPLHDVGQPEDRQRVKDLLDRVIQDAVRQQFDTIHTRTDGSTVHFSSIAAPVVVSGKVTGSVVSSRNITYRIKVEQEKDRIEEQLYQAQKMEAIGRLAGGVAHDFNNILCAITGNASLILDNPSPEFLQASIEEIITEAERATDLTRQLLAFSRKQIITLRVIDLNELIADMYPMLARLIGDDIILQTKLQSQLGRIRADHVQIEQVLLNLVLNARDAMPDGGELLIETTGVLLNADYCQQQANVTPGAYVRLSVTDTGCGMAEEVCDKIFEPFYTTKDKAKGTGLGLATVFGIVEQNSGRIEVHSELGKGSSFKVFFAPVEDQPEPIARSEKSALPSTGNETILLVEDTKTVRVLAKRLLERLGYRVLAASCGSDALALLERDDTSIDLLLTDVVMPKMDGRELATRVVQLRPDTRVLYTSGHAEEVIAHHGILDEGVVFLPKPFSLHALAARVREILDAPTD